MPDPHTERERSNLPSFHLSLAVGLGLILALALVSARARQAGIRFSTVDEIKTEFVSVPCHDQDRFLAARSLFEKMGASQSDLTEDNYKIVKNLVIRKRGSSEETIVIGAHYDKVSAGCGALDNWTGIVAIAHLYRSLKDVPTKKTFLFVAFGKEEQGLIGSQAMARKIDKNQLGQYCEMINIDTLGLAAPQVMDNTSNRKLIQLAVETAKDMKFPFVHAPIANADADSSSFKDRGMPALTIHGMTSAWPAILHSNNDQAAKVNPVSVLMGYQLALQLALRLDSAGCAAYR